MVTRMRRAAPGFTLIEMMVVLAIIGTLLALAMPKYQHSVDHSREAMLHHDLQAMRVAIDQFLADNGRYPASLGELVERRYLRSLPRDPVSDDTGTWIAVPPPEGVAGNGVYDVRSGAQGNALDGTRYDSW